MSLSQHSQRWAQRTAEAKEEIRQRILASPVVGGDETSLRQQGRLGWVWLLRTTEASLFTGDPSRGADVFDRLLPVGSFRGVFVSDFYNVYTRRTDLLPSYCGAYPFMAF